MLTELMPYLRLMRLDKPIGALLLIWPTLWALCMANQGLPPKNLFIIFVVGSLLMRSAGCVINDIADKNLDGMVKRTALRPLVTGEVTLKQAIILFLALLSSSAVLLLFLPIQPLFVAIIAALTAVIYPFCKRFISSPQVVLGIAFSWGIPLAYICSGKTVGWNVFGLVFINFVWILCYDSYYALVDKDDDLKIGVNSTAILFGQHAQLIINTLQFIIAISWLIFAQLNHLDPVFYIGWLFAHSLFVYQQIITRTMKREQFFQAFLNNNWYGLTMLISLWVALTRYSNLV